MAIQIESTLVALLKQNNLTPNGPVPLIFRETDFVNALRANGRVQDSGGASPFTWNVITVANTSAEVFVEGQAPPGGGSQTYQTASLTPFGVRAVYGMSRGAMINDEKRGYLGNALTVEQDGAMADMLFQLEAQLMGSTQDRGVASIIDSTGTYASLAQGTHAIWASRETALGGVLTIDALQTMLEDMTNGTVVVGRNARPTHWLLPHNQISNYLATIGTAAAAASNIFRAQLGQNDFGMGLARGGIGYDGIPFVDCRSMTTTEIYLVDLMDMALIAHGDVEENEIVGNPQMRQWEISSRWCLQVKSRNKHGKLTGVTA